MIAVLFGNFVTFYIHLQEEYWEGKADRKCLRAGLRLRSRNRRDTPPNLLRMRKWSAAIPLWKTFRRPCLYPSGPPSTLEK